MAFLLRTAMEGILAPANPCGTRRCWRGNPGWTAPPISALGGIRYKLYEQAAERRRPLRKQA